MEKESLIRYYILNTSFHGFRYIAEEGRHWTERAFWLICCILSWIASGLLIYSAWDDFQNNAISFVVETSYLEWDTQFPSITLCETDNQKRIAEVTDRTYGDPHDYDLDEIVKELVYFRGLSFYTLQICGPEAPTINKNCFKKNFSDFSTEVRSSCNDMLRVCKWNEVEFECCKYFTEVNTELGKCFAMNSIQTRKKKIPHYPMISNKTTGPGTLYLEISGFGNIYTLGDLEVPSLTTPQADVLPVSPHVHFQRIVAIKEIENQPETWLQPSTPRDCGKIFSRTPALIPCEQDELCSSPNTSARISVHGALLFNNSLVPCSPMKNYGVQMFDLPSQYLKVKDVSIEQRKCRFGDESDLDVYDYYSYSACCVQCRKNAQLRTCGCAHYFMPNTPVQKQCDINGLHCLNKHYNDLAVLKTPWANRTGLVCDCLPSCTEIELAIIKDDKLGIPEDYAIVELSLERLPTERFKRNVVRGKLDLVVSMGGSTALFLGASILSFVELIYYFTVRPVNDALASGCNKNKDKRNVKSFAPMNVKQELAKISN